MTPGTQLSALDTTFLELEQADASAHMHIGGVLVFEPGAPDQEGVLRRVAERLDGLPSFTRRLSSPQVSGLRRPHWVADPDFDLAAHVRRAALPAPGGDAELLDWAGDFYAHRLDRHRPLWELVVVEGLEGGRWAVATKMHHCLADGVGSLDMLRLFVDGAGPPPPALPRERHGLVHAGVDALRHPRRLAMQAEALAELAVREELLSAPPSSLNVPIGEHRRLAIVRTTLDETRAIRRRLGGTVNDVMLTAVASGLRDLLLSRGERPPRGGLRAMVPVNVRADADASLGNRVVSRFVALPVAEPDLLRRHAAVKRAARAAREGHQDAGAAALLELAEHLPPVLHATAARPVFGTRLFNVTVTNVPGSPVALHVFGSELREVWPIVPLAAEHAVGVAIISHAGALTLCVNADREAVPDVEVLAEGMAAAFEGLRGRALAPV